MNEDLQGFAAVWFSLISVLASTYDMPRSRAAY
jgi:hypothetical protein